MFSSLFIPVHTFGIMTLCALLYGVVHRRVADLPLRSACVGFVFGAGAVTVMLQPLSLAPGFQGDARSAFVVIAAVFGGPVASLVTVTMTITARAAIGGEGALPGCLVIIAAAVAAGTWHHFYGDGLKKQWPASVSICLLSTAPAAFALMSSPGVGVQPILFFGLLTAATVLVFGKMLESEEGRERRERELRTAASTDVLTGLPNRRAFERYAKQLEVSKAHDILLLLLDVDHFKSINDQYGHDEGDVVLRKIGCAISYATRESGFAARIGGEEFVIVMNSKNREAGLEVAERFRTSLQVSFGNEADKLNTRISIGGFYADGQPFDYSTAYRRADTALYRSKSEGRDRSTLYYDSGCEDENPARLMKAELTAQVSLSSLSAA